jgi:hypothetical protein
VTGPDEYNTVVNNNTYTNLMARENLRYAADTVATLKAEKPDILHAPIRKTGLEPEEADMGAPPTTCMFRSTQPPVSIPRTTAFSIDSHGISRARRTTDTPPAVLPSLEHLSISGDQAGRCHPGDVPAQP